MRPVLLEVAGLPIPSYGATLVATFLLGFAALYWQTRSLGVTAANVLDLAVLAVLILFGWVGAWWLADAVGASRGVHLRAMPLLALNAVGFLLYLRLKGLPAEAIFDRIAPLSAAALAALYGIGTWLAGTAFGKPTALPWAVVFPHDSPAGRVFPGIGVHPTQIYLGAGFLFVAVVFWRLRFATPGHKALASFIAMGTVYLLVSPLRGNTASLLAGQMPRLSEICVLLFSGFCGYMYFALRGKQEAPRQ